MTTMTTMTTKGAPSVVVIGAGQAGSDTVAALRENGFTGAITLVGEEDVLPYQRPPLSKGYLLDAGVRADLTLRSRAYYRDHAVDLVLGDRAVELDRELHEVLLASGTRLPYTHLVLATGARPRHLPIPGAELAGVLTLRRLADAEAVLARLSGVRHVTLIGGGFIGLELASTARALGLGATVIEAGPRLMAGAVSREMSHYLEEEHRYRGVDVRCGRAVKALHGDGRGNVATVETQAGELALAELVVVGVGVLPNTALAADAGLAVGDGILVDEHLRTSDPAVYAVGDCARFPSPHAGRPLRLVSVQNATDQARCAAAAICGDAEPYTALPWFWSEQYALRLQIAGVTDGHDRAVVVGDPSTSRFSVYCFRAGRLVGVESVNRPAEHLLSRRLLSGGAQGPTPQEAAEPGFELKTFLRARQNA
ncbi:NAD(P)/FAD-dependent oxidoreductase [Streptomyces sp. NRRL WC-3742]|uniref:NAD(P)/FAD-dependent oxidoreductase n=1 Tax=Streptomyces sp. NRRL WC-3742 TaxID=1463934 RepID=UPI000B2D9B07|nr:FAD-dependent oxidoreductase [Streptomyces sp. NRRL WC-3742]